MGYIKSNRIFPTFPKSFTLPTLPTAHSEFSEFSDN